MQKTYEFKIFAYEIDGKQDIDVVSDELSVEEFKKKIEENEGKTITFITEATEAEVKQLILSAKA